MRELVICCSILSMLAACGGLASTAVTSDQTVSSVIVAKATGKAQRFDIKFADDETLDSASPTATFTLSGSDAQSVLPAVIAASASPADFGDVASLAVVASQQLGGVAELSVAGAVARQSACAVSFPAGNIGAAAEACLGDAFTGTKLFPAPTSLDFLLTLSGASVLIFDGSVVTNVQSGTRTTVYGTAGSISKLAAPSAPADSVFSGFGAASVTGSLKATAPKSATDLNFTGLLVVDLNRNGRIDAGEAFMAPMPSGQEVQGSTLVDGAGATKILAAIEDDAVNYHLVVVGRAAAGLPQEGSDVLATLSLQATASFGPKK